MSVFDDGYDLSGNEDSSHDRNMARYERVCWLARRYFRRPWNLVLWWRVTCEMRELVAAMESESTPDEGDSL